MSAPRLVGFVLLATAVSVLIASPGLTRDDSERSEKWYSYLVPFTCGTNEFEGGSAVMGSYATAVTVSNPQSSSATVRARVQLTDPVELLSESIRRSISGEASYLVGCDHLDGAFQVPLPPDAFFQGVLSLRSRSLLSVVVQTSATGAEGGLSVHSREVTPQTVRHRHDH